MRATRARLQHGVDLLERSLVLVVDYGGDRGGDHLAHRHAHRGQRGHRVGRQGDVVETRNGQVIGHLQAALVGLVQCPDGQHVGRAHQCRRRLGQLEQAANSLAPAGGSVVRGADVALGQRLARPLNGCAERLFTFGDVAVAPSARECDAPMPESLQVPHDGLDAGAVIDADRGNSAGP